MSLELKNEQFVLNSISNGTIWNQTKLVADPITMQLAQGIARPSFNITLNVGLFCRGIQFFENFTLCDLDNFDVILGNTFLDAYKVDFLYNGGQ